MSWRSSLDHGWNWCGGFFVVGGKDLGRREARQRGIGRRSDRSLKQNRAAVGGERFGSQLGSSTIFFSAPEALVSHRAVVIRAEAEEPGVTHVTGAALDPGLPHGLARNAVVGEEAELGGSRLVISAAER